MDEEYELQYFGFSTTQMQEDFRFLIEIRTQKEVDNVAELLIKESGISSTKAENIREKTKKVLDKILKKIEPKLKKIDELSGNHFQIPKNIILIEDEEKQLDKRITDNEDFLQCELTKQEDNFKQQVLLLSLADAELKVHERIYQIIEQNKELFDRTDKALRSDISLINQKACVEQLSKIFKSNSTTDSGN